MNTELFERAAGAGGQLLRVDKRQHAGDADPRPSALLFTFDVGRILLSADPARGDLAASHIESAEAIPADLEDASEDEPWWRLLGARLALVRVGPDATQLELQFAVAAGRRRAAVLTLDTARVSASLRDLP